VSCVNGVFRAIDVSDLGRLPIGRGNFLLWDLNSRLL
jgi:hypothetical protein